MTVRLRDLGVATAYATVGVGDVEAEMTTARAAASERPKLRLDAPEIVFLLGQADVATIYETPNFKRIFELRYPRANSHASGVNWVFSVPFTNGRAAPVSVEEGPFRFIIHLRLRRGVYAYRGIEEKVTAKLEELLGRHAAGARIHVGLGWSDLVVEGYFNDDSFGDLADFIIKVHGLRIAHGSERTPGVPVVQRLLTVFGYRGDPPPFTKNAHLTFLRCTPGGYDDVVDLFADDDDDVKILDGKADFMIRSHPADPLWLKRQRELGDGRYKQFLRKVETHLMVFPAEKFARRAAVADLLIGVDDEKLHADDCGCNTSSSKVLDAIEETIKQLTEGGNHLLPKEQRYAIDNALFLLGAALRDSSTCCDIRDAVLACFGGLLAALQHILKKVSDFSGEDYAFMWARLDDWHRLSELLLRQRMVGSHEEILGTSDRSVVYSGGVQKFLYLADQVMMDFARRLQPIDPPAFATIYDSVKTILSFPTSGRLVRIPTSQMFSFPLIVPDLWHEVAGTLFFLRYQHEFETLVSKEDYNDFLANLADHYADLLVYLHGFRGHFLKFAVSLFHGWGLAYRDVPEAVKRPSRSHLLLRLYLVFEFDQFRAIQRKKLTDEAVSLADASEDVMVERLATFLELYLPDKTAKFVADDWKLLRSNVFDSDVFNDIHRQLYRPFLRTEVAAPPVDLEPFRRGEIVDLAGYDLNALFGELSYDLAQRYPKTDFCATAAVGESAALEYHRRQMNRNERADIDAAG